MADQEIERSRIVRSVSDLPMSDQMQRIARRSPRFSPEQGSHANMIDCHNSGEKQTNCKQRILRKRIRGAASVSFFIGDPVPDDEARRRWPYRYQNKRQGNNSRSTSLLDSDEDELVFDVKCHYFQAKIEKCVFDIGDCAYVKGEKGKQNFVGRIVEFFQTVNDQDYFRVQWFYRAKDTVMEDEAKSHDKKRLFISDIMNDNPLDCIVSKVKVVQVPASVDITPKSLPAFDYYYDMKYNLDYTTFSTVVDDPLGLPSCDNMKKIQASELRPNFWNFSGDKPHKSNMALLDLYSGCGGMSTGLSLGAKLAGVNLDTRWAVEIDISACDSLRINHPQAEVWNDPAEDFLGLLKEWDKLCSRYVDARKKTKSSPRSQSRAQSQKRVQFQETKYSKSKKKNSSDEFEVASLIDICYCDPHDTGKRGLHFLVRWAGYGPSEDTLEPIEELSNCQEMVQDFVLKGFKDGILPRPGDVDVICGGPPCQGISGYNRFRNFDNPLDDERNRQIVIFMDTVEFLKPTYVLMENVTDILRFANARLGRYAISRLVRLKYQASLGIMAAGCYGLPQFRLRVFLWGAHPNVRLPQYPLPTHDVIVRYGAPYKFERNVVAYDEHQSPDLEKALVIEDALYDLPSVTNNRGKEEMSYKKAPETEFQKYIRASQCEMMGTFDDTPTYKRRHILYDHRPLLLSEDDYLRVTQIPQRKGANFRDLPGLIIGRDNVVRRDPTSDMRLPSGRQLVPDYAINYCEGKSLRPFARLWWDDTVPTILTRPDPHSQAILHPVQDRVLTIRECARLQGFPDYYRFCGSVKERYCQVGNAVAVSVARALGYALGMAVELQKLTEEGPLIKLPPMFSHTTAVEYFKSLEKDKE